MTTPQGTTKTFGKAKPTKRKNYVRQIELKIQSLFANGYLRREEFGSFFSGEPEWGKNTVSTIEISKSSCGNLSNS